jgi:chemotaxis signal transduction protein
MTEVSAELLQDRFRARARSLATTDGVRQAQKAQSHILVRAGGETCALRVADVSTACRIDSLAGLPQLPRELAGMIVVRGRIWPVLDLAKLIGLPTADDQAPRFALLLKHRTRRAGVGVAALEGMRTLGEPATHVTEAALRAIAVPSEGILLVDAEAILSHPLIARGQMS